MSTLGKRMTKLGATVQRSLLRRVQERLDANETPGRGLQVHPDDTFIVSYPKSGNTWTRFLVSNLLHPQSSTDFTNIDERVPTIYKATTSALASIRRPRVLKSHEYFDPRYPRVIYVVRDPRDVLVSYYHYAIRRGFISADEKVDDYAERFLAGTLNAYGTWHENVASWRAARRDHAAFLMVRYEDLLSDGVAQLDRIAKFLGQNLETRELARVVDECSFEKMRALEASADEGAAHTMRHVRKDVAFVRSGKSGGWRSELSAAVVAKIASAWGSTIAELGYSR